MISKDTSFAENDQKKTNAKASIRNVNSCRRDPLEILTLTNKKNFKQTCLNKSFFVLP